MPPLILYDEIMIQFVECGVTSHTRELIVDGLNYYTCELIHSLKYHSLRLGMMVKKPEHGNKLDIIICPNCKAKITIEDLGMVMFESATVFSCPICEKTIALQPKGEEFKIKDNNDNNS